ncbi:MAG: BREX-1 system adenine-specific DNA-methyltransferase PglX [Gemmiger qucibialis]
MDKPAIKKFAVWARNKLIADTKYRAGLVGVTETAVAEPLPQSNETVQFFDVGLPQPYRIEGDAVTQRQRFVAELNKETAKQGSYTAAYQTVVDKVAYTWFNRLIAVRYMEVNDLLPSRTRVLSSADGRAEPQIVTSPFDAVLDYTPAEQQQIVNLKNDNKLDEAFRLLFLKQCAALGDCLPRLFEQVDDYMPLLLALSFTDKDGVVCHLVNDIPESDWQDAVQIVGWLYQYYNTEPKEQVFANLKKNIKISAANIPAATQLFTPDWIVRYMVENSLGRLWSEGHPDFDKSEWKYYLDEAPQEPQVVQQLAELRKGYAALTPEDIKCIDPCMGSGHILAYLFDVLMQIYRSAGYTDRDAAASIVEHNLYGLDIDDRAAQMAYFVVMMKGCHYDSRFLRRHLNPHVYAIQESGELSQTAFGYCGPEEPTARTLWDTFRNAKEYGSILQPKVTLEELDKLEARLQEADRMAGYGSLGVQGLTYQLLDVMYPLIDQARMLVQKYDVVVTNPPYMGGSGMNARLSDYVKKVYPDSKSDLFACFMERADAFVKENRFTSLITMESWMFLSSFEKLRDKVNLNKTIVNMVHMPYLGKGGTSLGINFGTAAVVMKKGHIRNYAAQYEYTVYYECDEEGVPFVFPTKNERWKTATQENFSKIPGSPVAYWVSENFIGTFLRGISIDSISKYTGSQNITANNEKYLRYIWEVVNTEVGTNTHWAVYIKGGTYRKWYGNIELVVDWSDSAREFYKNNPTSNLLGKPYRFREGITYTELTSGTNSFRYLPAIAIFDKKGPCIVDVQHRSYCLAFFNTKVAVEYFKLLNPTITLQVKDVKNTPIIFDDAYMQDVESIANSNVELCRKDWDSFETSWDFKHHPLV